MMNPGGGGGGGTIEERVQAAAARLAGRAECVDVLVASLGRVIANPSSEKYRTINPANPAFARTVGATPGGVEFLTTIGYEPLHGQLVLQSRDPALLWLGKSALEANRNSEAYLASRESDEVVKALDLSEAEYRAEDAARRAALAKRVPPEPAEGAAGSTKICMHVGASSTWRRFEHDLTLEDVCNWAQSLPNAPRVETPIQLRLADVTTRPARTIDVGSELGHTLKHLGLWPSGQLRLRVDGQDEAFDMAMQNLVRLPSEDRA